MFNYGFRSMCGRNLSPFQKGVHTIYSEFRLAWDLGSL